MRRTPRMVFGMVCLAVAPALAGAAPAKGSMTIKPYLKGLISMGDAHCIAQGSNECQPDNSMSDAFGEPGILQGYVINVTWAQLQPASSTAIDPGAIDRALAALRRYNADHTATPMRALLRVEAGSVAPDWAKALAGGPVTIYLRVTLREAQIGRFWTEAYRGAWRGLQDKLAARYDANKLIAEVSDTSCSHESDEPYVNPLDSDSIRNLYAAGYSNQAFVACLRGSIHDYDAWATTPVDFPTSNFEDLTDAEVDGERDVHYGPHDMAVTRSIMREFRAALGPRAILANHNLNDPLGWSVRPIYDVIAELGKPVELQTVVPGARHADGTRTGKLRNWAGTIALGLRHGASAVEVWRSRTNRAGQPIQDGWNAIRCAASAPNGACDGQDPAMLKRWSRALIAAAPDQTKP